MYNSLKSLLHNRQFEDVEGLILDLYPDLYRYIYYFVNDYYLAEDILHDTILIAYSNFTTLRDISKFKAWIYKIARHECIRSLKKASKQVVLDNNYFEATIQEEFSFDTNADVKLVLKEMVKNLNPEEKHLLYLIYHLNLSLKEVGIILKTNVNTIKSKHKRVKKKLHDELKRHKISGGCI